MNNNQEIIIPPPIEFRNKSVFVLCDPTKIDFKRELQRMSIKRIYNIKEDGTIKKQTLKGFCDRHSIFGSINCINEGFGEVSYHYPKIFRDIHNIKFETIKEQYWGYKTGLDKCGVEVLFVRSKKTTDNKIKQYCKVKNNGEPDSRSFTLKDAKNILKMNGVKGYSKFDKLQCIQALIKL